LKNFLLTIIKFAISAALIFYLFRNATLSDDFGMLFNSEKRWGWLAAAFIACTAGFVLGFVRWHSLVRALGLPFKLIDAIRLGFIGLFFCVFTIGVAGGDAMRAVYVCRQAPGRKTEVVASVVFDRLIGLLTMVGIAAIAFGRLNVGGLSTTTANEMTLFYAGRFTMLLSIAGFAGFAVLLAIPEFQKFGWSRKFLLRLFAVPWIGGFVRKMTDVVAVYRTHLMTIVTSFFLSVGVNVCFAVTIFAIAIGLGADCPDLGTHFLIEPIAMVANSLPLPGGIGGMEAAVAFLYKVLADGNGVIVAFTFRFFMLIVSAIGGAVWLLNKETFNVSPGSVEDVATSS
jgi:uncharacterized protein (TIRG00374 family)